MTERDEAVILHPDVKLEDVRDAWDANECFGRGRGTAAGRGYNTERLAAAVLSPGGEFISWSKENWYDTFCADDNLSFYAECKSCVYEYPSGQYARFRIWRDNHLKLLRKAETTALNYRFVVYFFVVYEISDEIEQEVGKVVAPVELVEEVLDNWKERSHQTMGTQEVRDISWHLLFKRLGVSERRLRDEGTVNLTSVTP